MKDYQSFNDFEGLFRFHINRNSARHSKQLLMFMEDLQKEHQMSISRSKLVIPKEYHDILDQLDLLNSEKMDYVRKRILDINGDFKREAELELNKYEITIKKNKKEKGI